MSRWINSQLGDLYNLGFDLTDSVRATPIPAGFHASSGFIRAVNSCAFGAPLRGFGA